MDLSFPPLLPDRALAVQACDLALLVAAATAARADDATVRAQAVLDAAPLGAGQPASQRFAPADGSFDAAVATALARWREE